MSQATQQPYHQAYVLWLIRGGITSWNSLCSHFDLDPREILTGQNMLLGALRSLSQAQLIDVDPETEFIRLGSYQGIDGDVVFSPTALLGHVQDALKISLADLAKSDPAQRLLVSPIPQRSFSSRYKSDILVLMPFSPELQPVYDDHLKAVAVRLGLKIARADDFFTSEHIMDEIWTAIVDARLVVADCTGRNPNVFYEIGLAHAVGKPTVLITQSPEDVPFDLRHRRYLTYALTPRGMKDFEEVLRKTIETILPEGISSAT